MINERLINEKNREELTNKLKIFKILKSIIQKMISR
jgi:hypothetical protein